MKIWWCAVYNEGKLERFDFCDPTFPDQAGDHSDCGPMRLIPDNAETVVVEKIDGEWPEGVEVWWFCKTEGQRRKKYLGCFAGLNCRSDSGCGLRLFVPFDALSVREAE